MAGVLAPSLDLNWLTEIANDLDFVAYPLERFDRIVTSEVLIRAGLTLVKEAQVARRRRPMKNFSELELSHSFAREQDRWAIKLPGREV
ncbi:hypothetical protein ILT44_18495 [Microvirga sp. BT689]|uniref:hypothetical protein n=1 Tax=Microvirga arvi TaxID=2778731 RepID=UPI0019526EDB|nr:hypothetical protein [Microvirga arvi]MBM6582196.1 hypothetical protein [Microvirga arvi]